MTTRTRKTKTRKTKKRVRLPNSMPALTELAVRDVIRCERQPKKYRLDMAKWLYRPQLSKPCSVCMAGAVMAQTLGVRLPVEGTGLDPLSLGDEHARVRLYAINAIRTGDAHYAYYRLGRVPPAGWEQVEEGIRNGCVAWLGRAPWPVYLRAAKDLRRLEHAEKRNSST